MVVRLTESRRDEKVLVELEEIPLPSSSWRAAAHVQGEDPVVVHEHKGALIAAVLAAVVEAVVVLLFEGFAAKADRLMIWIEAKEISMTSAPCCFSLRFSTAHWHSQSSSSIDRCK